MNILSFENWLTTNEEVSQTQTAKIMALLHRETNSNIQTALAAALATHIALKGITDPKDRQRTANAIKSVLR